MEKIKNHSIIKTIGSTRLILLGVILVLYILFSVLTPVLRPGSTFLSFSRILNALNYCYFIGFMALGVMFVISTGGIDFSIGPVMFAAGLVGGYCLTAYHLPLAVCLIICLAVGVAFGVLNGFFVAYLHLPSFITSLASMQIAKGFGSVFTKTQVVAWPANGQEGDAFRLLVRWGNFPTGVVLFLGVAVICAVVMHKTKAGRYILCLGSNREASRISGVNIQKWEMLAFILCGLMAGVASIFYVGAYTTVQPGLGDTLNNDAIAACVMGGTLMIGGTASVLGVVIGAVVIALIQEGIMAMGFTISWQYIITGIIVVVAVILNTKNSRRRA